MAQQQGPRRASVGFGGLAHRESHVPSDEMFSNPGSTGMDDVTCVQKYS